MSAKTEEFKAPSDLKPGSIQAFPAMISFRDWTAALVLQGLLSGEFSHRVNKIDMDDFQETAARIAVVMADKLIAELKK